MYGVIYCVMATAPLINVYFLLIIFLLKMENGCIFIFNFEWKVKTVVDSFTSVQNRLSYHCH